MAETKTSSATQEQTRQQDQNQQGSRRQTAQGLQSQRSPRSGSVQRYGATDAFASPFQFMRRMTQEMDRLFDRVFDDFTSGRSGGLRDYASTPAFGDIVWAPRIEALQKGSEFIVRAELPGLKKDDVKVNVTDDSIVIEGQRHKETKDEREGFYHSERSYGSFYREIPLPEGTITDDAQASFKDGVLEVKLHAPPREVSRGRSIEIK